MVQRMTIRYEGRVQGVGFRVGVHQQATGLPVVGTVCNLHSGGVLLVAEGDPDALLSLRNAVAAERVRNIVRADESWMDIDELSFDDFQIVPDAMG